MKLKITSLAAAAAMLGSASFVGAKNITIYDGFGSPAEENQEIEPGVDSGPKLQFWDLERFDLVGNTLTLQAGYNLVTGAYPGQTGKIWRPGDLFFSSDGSAAYGSPGFGVNGGAPVLTANQWGYDYVMAFDRNANGSLSGTYSVLQIDANSKVWDVGLNSTDPSNPWKYGSDAVATLSTGNLYGLATFLDAEGTHYQMSVDIGLIPALGSGWLVHYTYECGNDSSVGYVPDGGFTLMMLGMGIGLIETFRRRMLA